MSSQAEHTLRLGHSDAEALLPTPVTTADTVTTNQLVAEALFGKLSVVDGGRISLQATSSRTLLFARVNNAGGDQLTETQKECLVTIRKMAEDSSCISFVSVDGAKAQVVKLRLALRDMFEEAAGTTEGEAGFGGAATEGTATEEASVTVALIGCCGRRRGPSGTL